MKKLIEIFYDYLWNPKKKQNILEIIELCKKDKILNDHIYIFSKIIEESKDDSIASERNT
jgi:hypothetical protein